MTSIIDKNIKILLDLCKGHFVKSMSVFGSATNDSFNEDSDIDFLVQFNNELELLEYADNYFSLKKKLENIFKRNVDLVSEKSLKNPYLIKEINRTKVSVYES